MEARKPHNKAPPIWMQNLVYLLHTFIHCKASVPVNAIIEASNAALFVANVKYTAICLQNFNREKKTGQMINSNRRFYSLTMKFGAVG